MNSFRRYVVLVGIAGVLACSQDKKVGGTRPRDTEARAEWMAAHSGGSANFSIRLERHGDKSSLTFAYGERSPTPLRVLSLLLGRQDHPEDFCRIEAKDKATNLLVGAYVLGSTPPDYQITGCKRGTLNPGDYDLMLETDKGPVLRRMYIKRDLSAEFRFWEEYSGLRMPAGH
jgi:hypothetical protein